MFYDFFSACSYVGQWGRSSLNCLLRHFLDTLSCLCLCESFWRGRASVYSLKQSFEEEAPQILLSLSFIS